MINKEFFNGKDLLEKYRDTSNPDFVKELSHIYNINNKYKLSPGTETDFENITNFLKFAITKNSKVMDEYENAFSSMFGGYLKKYFNTFLSEDDLCDMLSNIRDYNKQIEDEYNINFNPDSQNGIKFEWKHLIKILENICGINTENLKIKKNSVADKLYTKIEKNIENSTEKLKCSSDLKQNIISILVLYILVSNFIVPYVDTIPGFNPENHVRQIKESILPYLYTNKDINFGIKNYTISEKVYDRYSVSYEFMDSKSNMNFHFDVPVRKLEMQLKNQFNDKTINMSIGECKDIPIAYGTILQNSEVLIYHTNMENEIPGLKVHIADITYVQPSIEDPTKQITIIDMAKVINLVNNSEGKEIIDKQIELGITASEIEESICIKVNDSIVNKIKSLYQNDDKILKNIFKEWTSVLSTQDTRINAKIKYYNIDIIKVDNQIEPSTLASFFYYNETNHNYKYDIYISPDLLEQYPLISVEYDIMMNTFKIYSEVIVSNQINNDLFEIEQSSNKMNADSIETFYALNHTNVIPMTFSLYVSEKSNLFNILNNKFNLNITSGATVRIGIIYKEFNDYIRDIDMSNIQNRIIGEYITNNKNSITNSQTILTEKIYYAITSTDYGKDVFEYNERLLFTETKTNDLIIRNSVVNDLISYISGSLINFGNKISDKTDIQKILKLYKECRDYFYRVLYNTSFMLEDTYELYVVLFIKAQTIERFISSRLDDFLNINNYTEDDCRNFLISYGLKALSDQVDDKNFVNSIEYKKRIIADYNDIMSKKGSRSIIDEFFKIFNYNKNEIEIYKYLIFKDKNNSKDNYASNIQSKAKINKFSAQDQDETYIKFASAPYYSKNIYHDIKYSIDKNTAERYEDFISNDKYWTKDDLPEEKVKEELVAPVNTKYLGLDLKKDLYYNIIISKYILSINNFLYENLFLNGQSLTDNNGGIQQEYTKLYFGKNFQFNLPDFAKPEYSFDIGFLYNSLRFLFSVYVYYYENYMKIPNENIELAIADKKIKYLGINTNNFISKPDLGYSDFIKKLFSTYFAKYNDTYGKFELLKENKIEYYVHGSKISPFDIDDTKKYYFSNDKTENSNSNIFQNTKLLPVTNVLYSVDQKEQILDNSKAKVFDYICKDIHTNNIGENQNKYLSSKNIVEDAFDSINLINLFNKYNSQSKEQNIDKDMAQRDSYTRMIYYFNKFKENSIYPKKLNDFGLMENAVNELELKNFYKYLYENILKFPLDYLLGNHESFLNTKYDIEERRLFDKIFNDFFLTDTPIIPVVKETKVESKKVTYTLDTSYLDSIISEMYLSFHVGKVTKIEDKQKLFLEIVKNMFGDGIIASIQLNTDESYSHMFKTSLFGYPNKENLENSDYKPSIEATNKLIINLTEKLNSVVEGFDNLKMQMETSESVNNFFDFVITSVSFFISYTALLYKTNLIMSIDAKSEKVPIVCGIKDQISNNISEYGYYDESITIKTIENPGGK